MSRKRRRSGKQGTRDDGSGGEVRAESRTATSAGTAARGRSLHPLDHWLIALAIAGVALTSYLTFVAWFGTSPAYCGAGSDCELVQQSRWSTFLGAPMALWGLLTYAILVRLVWRLRTRPSAWPMALLVASVGAGVSWYLTAVSVFVIEATCGYCLASFGIMNALLVLLLIRRPAHVAEHAWQKSLPLPAGSAALVVLALFLHFSGFFDPAAGAEKPHLRALAVHLRDSGTRFYGAYWCPACQAQKELFGASAERLPYVECTPNGRKGAVSHACVASEVHEYPTWIIGGQRHSGVLPLSELARLSGFDGAIPAPAR